MMTWREKVGRSSCTSSPSSSRHRVLAAVSAGCFAAGMAPFWFAFAGSALILALIWQSLLHIAHADEQTRADAPQPCSVSGGKRFVDPGPQGGQGDGAGLPGGHLPAAQHQQGRDGLDPESL